MSTIQHNIVNLSTKGGRGKNSQNHVNLVYERPLSTRSTLYFPIFSYHLLESLWPVINRFPSMLTSLLYLIFRWRTLCGNCSGFFCYGSFDPQEKIADGTIWPQTFKWASFCQFLGGWGPCLFFLPGVCHRVHELWQGIVFQKYGWFFFSWKHWLPVIKRKLAIQKSFTVFLFSCHYNVFT